MTNAHRKSIEFEATIDRQGRIAVPPGIAEELRGKSGGVLVRVTSNAISNDLKDRKVDEEEIECIGRMQFESREQVVKFLLSEGSLRKTRLRRGH